MTDSVLVINAGSSSIKFAVYPVDGDWKSSVIFRGQTEGIGHAPRFRVSDAQGVLADEAIARVDSHPYSHQDALSHLLKWLAAHAQSYRLVGAGHRVVHGGEDLCEPVRIDEYVIGILQGLVPLARLHEPHELAAILALRKLEPDLPQVACFDTEFHRTQPAVARMFALPREITDAGVKRYGFHGLSYEYIAGVLPEYLGSAADGRIVVAHLGNGASMCAMRARQSVATTMGFTALEGLVMGTRSGALDPGVVLYLIQERGMTAHQVSDVLYKRSGLLGVSGISHDMRTLLATDHPHAREAIELFVYRVNRELGSLIASLGGLDALVFTGGIGEHADSVRARVCEQAVWAGIHLDPAANAGGASRISAASSPVSVWVIPTNEELVIARHTCRLLQAADLVTRKREQRPVHAL